ncbi:MAG: tonB-system energizer ExbB, partial [Stenotrophomonas maltophilia]
MTLPIDVPAAVAALPHDLTPWGMYQAADGVVQTVMIGLALASIATWTVLVAKTWELGRQRTRLRQARALLLQSAQLPTPRTHALLDEGVAHALIDAARTELRLSQDAHDPVGIKERVASRLERIELAHARQLRTGVGLLASIG